jgi:hypothetical protein
MLIRLSMISRLIRFIVLILIAHTVTSCGGGSGGGGGGVVGNVMLEWTAPSARENGDGLSMGEIASYRIYYSTVEGNYTFGNSVLVSGSTQRITLSDQAIPKGTYFFVLTTIDTAGRESGFSRPAVELRL